MSDKPEKKAKMLVYFMSQNISIMKKFVFIWEVVGFCAFFFCLTTCHEYLMSHQNNFPKNGS